MHRSLYDTLSRLLRLPFAARPHLELIAKQYGVSVDTLSSIYSQESQLRLMRTHHKLKQNIALYCERYCEGEDILQLCANIDFPACMLMRRMLEHLPLGLGKQAAGRVLKEPQQLLALAKVDAEHSPDVHALIPRLLEDIARCVDDDRTYSPKCDVIRHEIGVKYERQLEEHLRANQIAFWSEETLRLHGFFKTPDAKLQVPIAVRGRIVNWIDSKATFGDEHMHRQQLEEQYQKYVNRYGPGLVIYWFGYIDDLEQLAEDVVLAAVFPPAKDLTLLPCLPIPSDDVACPVVTNLAGQAGAAEAAC